MGRLDGKVAIVTGSTSGIGIGIARLYAKEGAKVVICGRREEKGMAVVNRIVEEGGEASYHFLDVTKIETIKELIDDTAAKYGKIDILVNNAANVGLPDGTVEQVTLEMWDNIFASDIRGTFYATQCVLKYMKENNGGSIINIGSMASCGGDLGATAYSAAKAGVDMLTESTALQYGKFNIRCNCVRPGLIVTPENDAYVAQAVKDIFVDNILVNRYGCPEDIGHLCVYLGSDESGFMSGQILTVDGGMNTHVPTVVQFRNLGSRTW